jgi:cyclic pyranopterin phosphate synthase
MPSTAHRKALQCGDLGISRPSPHREPPMGELSHFDAGGASRMVDVGDKPVTRRLARASARVRMAAETLALIKSSQDGGRHSKKGDVLEVARLAGIMAAKRTSEIVPLCHLLALSHVSVELETDLESRSVAVTATVEAIERTGVEMEALVAASAAALTIYDMLKAFDRAMEIGPTRLLFKSGGRTGDFVR